MDESSESERTESYAAEAARLEQLAEDLQEVERLQLRLDGLRERRRAYDADRDALQSELASKKGERRRIRWGVRGLWSALRGTRARELQELDHAIERVGRRLQSCAELVASLEAEHARATAAIATHKSAAELRVALVAGLDKQRARLERDHPELGARLRTLEAELPEARAEHAAAERALANVHLISSLLESARANLDRALNVGTTGTFLLDWFLVSDATKYHHINEATTQLRTARALMDDLRILDSVRDDLEPLEPEVRDALRLADFWLDSFVAELAVMVRTETSQDGVVEAQKLFADLERILERAARHARHHAGNLERAWRAALLDAATATAGAVEVEPKHP